MTRIIYADDEPVGRVVFSAQIDHILSGETPDLVENGRELVEQVRLNTYSLVLTDNNMPGLWGIDAIREIRTFNPEVPIYLTSVNDVERELWEAVGANGFLNRSPEHNYLTKLTEVIRRYLD